MKHSNYDDCNLLTTPGGDGEPSDQLMISLHVIITDHHLDLGPAALTSSADQSSLSLVLIFLQIFKLSVQGHQVINVLVWRLDPLG